jgi:hypothetical protein
MPNAFVDGEGWNIYSVKNSNGWLDLYRYNTQTEGKTDTFFAVRARSVNHPVTSWSQDGC